MKTNRKWVALVLFTLTLGSAGAFAVPVNLLTNPGFETGDFSGWAVGGSSPFSQVAPDGTPIPLPAAGSFTPGISNVRSGQFSGSAHVRGDPPLVITLSQVISVQQNDNINVGFWVGHGEGTNLGGRIDPTRTMIFIDGAPILPNSNPIIPGGTLPTDFLQIAGAFNTGNRNSVTVTFQIDGSGTFNAGVSFDDFFFDGERVPESSTVALLGLGLIGLAIARRRRRG